jgi:hypothetical protein
MTAEGIQVVHALPGRVRFKAAKFKRDPELARRASEKLAQVPGIHKVETNPLTGSVLVLFDLAQLAGEAIEPLGVVLAEFFPEMEALSLVTGLAALAETPVHGGNPGGGLAAGVGALNAGLARLTGGLDLKVLAPLALFFLGIRGLLTEKKAFPAWYDYFWFGFSTLVMLNRDWFEGERREKVATADTRKAEGGGLKQEGGAV